MLRLDWNTLIVGKLSPWINADSDIETERRNSEAVSSSLGTYNLFEGAMDVVAVKERVLWHNIWPSLSKPSLWICVLPPSCCPLNILLCFSPGSDAGAKLLSLPRSASLHDPYTWSRQCQSSSSPAKSHPHWTPHLKCKACTPLQTYTDGWGHELTTVALCVWFSSGYVSLSCPQRTCEKIS